MQFSEPIKRLAILCFLLFQGICPALAQQPIWRSLDVEDGVPDPSVTSFLRLPNGLLFLGTSSGLYQFDGANYNKIEFPASLKINPFINSLASDGKYIYAGARNALVRYSLRDRSMLVFKNSQTFYAGVNKLIFNHDSSMLVCYTHAGFILLDSKNGNLRLLDTIPCSGVLDFHVGNDGTLYYAAQRNLYACRNHQKQILATDPLILDATWSAKDHSWISCRKDGLYKLDPNWTKAEKLPYESSFHYNSRHLLNSDTEGTIWLFSENMNEVIHSLSDSSISIYTSEQGNKYTIGSNSVNGFYQDPTGTFWAGGDGSGLSYKSVQQSVIGYLSNETLGAGSVWFFKRLEDENRILIGTSYGIVIGRLINGKILDRKLYRPEGEKKFPVGCVLDLNKDEYLVSSYGRGCWIWNKKTLKFTPHTLINNSIQTDFFYGFRRLANGNILVLTSVDPLIYNPVRKTITLFDPNLTSFDNIICCYEDKERNLWLGTGLGLKIFNSNLKLIHSYTNSNDSAYSISSNVILDIKPGTDGIVYFATMGGGFCCLDTKINRFRSIPLSTNPVNIYGIVQIPGDKMLLTTSNGLCLLNLKDGSSVILNRSNILPFNDFNQMAFYRDEDYILTAGEKGVLIIKSGELEKAFENKTELKLLSGNISVNELIIPAGKQSLDLTVLLKNCLPGQLPLFEHWLEGVDDEYHRLPKGQNQISYNYLPPGKYRLHVRIIDETGFIQAKEQVITVEVEAMFWQTAWFRIFAGIIALGIIFLIVRYLSWIRLRWKLQKLDAERKIAIERTRISRELHDNLGSQLTYLISGLETSEMMLEFEKLEELPANLNKLQLAARESMQQLRDSIWALAPGSMTIEGLLVQFEKWFYRIMENKPDIQSTVENEISLNSDIDPIVGLNLFRIMQEAVHNFIKHANASQVKVRLANNENELLIEVIDNGVGIKSKSQEGHGLTSMQQRAVDVHASIEITDNKPAGTRISIRLPKNRLNG